MKTIQEIYEERKKEYEYLRRAQIPDIIIPDEAPRRTIHTNNEKITVYEDIANQIYPSNHYIISHINWHTIPPEHSLYDDRPRQRYAQEKQQHIQQYTAVRGAIIHRYIQNWDKDDDFQDVLKDSEEYLTDLDQPPESKHDDIYQTISNWSGSPLTNPEYTPPDPHTQIRKAAENEAEKADLEFSKWRQGHDIRILRTEHKYSHEVDRHGHGGQADLLIDIPQDSSLDVEKGIYAPEIKTTPQINNSHRIQAEAHRRAYSDDMGFDVGGMILQVTPDGVDVETHLEDTWKSDALWDTFTQKIDHLYDNTLLEVKLTLGR